LLTQPVQFLLLALVNETQAMQIDSGFVNRFGLTAARPNPTT
jgi:hypothetical protein